MSNKNRLAIDTFGGQLAKLRMSHKLSQATVADTAGISTGYYSAIECDKRLPPPMGTLARILSALKCTDAETTRLQAIAATERGISSLELDLPEEVQALIVDLRTHGHELPTKFVKALRVHIREAKG